MTEAAENIAPAQSPPANPALAALPRFDIVFLDMDGVLSDMVGPLLKLHNRNVPYGAPNGWWKPGEYNMAKVLGISEAKMWEMADEQPNFWHGLPKLPHADAVLRIANSISDQTCILTKPHRHESSYAGKFDWWGRNCSSWGTKLILTGEKHLLARPGRLLIDDRDENCDAFRAAGGSAILFPQHWNSAHDKAPFGPLFYLAQELAKLAQEQRELPDLDFPRPSLDSMGVQLTEVY